MQSSPKACIAWPAPVRPIRVCKAAAAAAPVAKAAALPVVCEAAAAAIAEAVAAAPLSAALLFPVKPSKRAAYGPDLNTGRVPIGVLPYTFARCSSYVTEVHDVCSSMCNSASVACTAEDWRGLS